MTNTQAFYCHILMISRLVINHLLVPEFHLLPVCILSQSDSVSLQNLILYNND